VNLTGRVEAVLGRGILPSVIARGANMRVAAVQDGVAILEVTGSPGAAFPLAARIETLIRTAVPEITGVRLVTPGSASAGTTPAEPEDPAGLAEAARRVLDAEINPAIAAHRGHVSLAGAEDGWVRVRLEGGCQGCSLAEVTLRQGIEPLLRARLPGVTGLIDVTDHEAGTEPFFSAEKR
jgi:Fe-S cluster biogenesis protein NfuA